jgi:hypothetical protein
MQLRVLQHTLIKALLVVIITHCTGFGNLLPFVQLSEPCRLVRDSGIDYNLCGLVVFFRRCCFLLSFCLAAELRLGKTHSLTGINMASWQSSKITTKVVLTPNLFPIT